MIKSHNKKNKKEIAKTISILIDDKNGIPEYIQMFLVDRLLWAATEYDDNLQFNKYFGVPFWSYGAIAMLIENINSNNKADKNLVHEHSIPKCVIGEKLDELYESKNTLEDIIYNLLDKFCHSAIVSKDEDKIINKVGYRSKMPNTFAFQEDDDVFARYRIAGVKIYSLDSADLLQLSKNIIPDGGLEKLTKNKVC